MSKEKTQRNIELAVRRFVDGESCHKLSKIYNITRKRVWEITHRTRKKYEGKLKEKYPEMYG